MSKSFISYGQNVIVEPLDKKEESRMGKVVSTPFPGKCPVGSIVLYTERDYENLYVGEKLLHVLWEPRIRAILIDKDETNKLAGEFPNMQKDIMGG